MIRLRPSSVPANIEPGRALVPRPGRFTTTCPVRQTIVEELPEAMAGCMKECRELQKINLKLVRCNERRDSALRHVRGDPVDGE